MAGIGLKIPLKMDKGPKPVGVIALISLKIPLKMDSKARLSAFLTACSAPLLVV